jgi:hypothetical protein
MTDQGVIDFIEKEFKNKRLGAIEQYLEIHSPIYSDNKLIVERIDRHRQSETIIAYIFCSENFNDIHSNAQNAVY